MKTNIENEFITIQNNLASKIELKDTFTIEELQTVSGVDLAYWQKEGKDFAVCTVVAIDYKTHQVVEIKSKISEITVPYIPGFLSFRELPLILETFELLETNTDLIFFDGNGYLHPRHMGLATHAAFYLKKPTIGVAKTYLKIKEVEFKMPTNTAGSYTDIIIEGEIYGCALRTHENIKPIFVSSGNEVTLSTATEIIMSLIEKESRQPLPTRLADLETKRIKREESKK